MDEERKLTEETKMKDLFRQPNNPAWTNALLAAVNTASAENSVSMKNQTPASPKRNSHASFEPVIRKHRRRKWDAVAHAVIAQLLVALIYVATIVGICPAFPAAVIMVLIGGYTWQMGMIVLQEVVWYNRCIVRKQVRA